MQVILATEADVLAWLDLAREVEVLFGAPMADDPGFRQILLKNIRRETALCVRMPLGQAGLCGALLFSPSRKPVYEIHWLAVSASCRRQGVGQALVERAISLVEPPAEVIVTTFAAGTPDGEAARYFYIHLGFTPAEILSEAGPNREPRQRFRKSIP